MKLRILKKGQEFFCQKKWIFWWVNFKRFQHHTPGGYWTEVRFDSFNKAKDYMDEKILKENIRRTPSKIMKYYEI